MPDPASPKGPRELYEAIRELGRVFREAGVHTAGLDARLLASHVCALTPEQTIAEPGFMLSPEMTVRINEVAARRLAGEPVSRIIGYREFWGLLFGLSPHTLDPRPETELLVEAVLDYVRAEGLSASPIRILDLGTGSGCLLGALLSELPQSTGVGVDLSQEALCTARENLRRLGLLNRASFLCADWARALGDASFDIIVSNPPYIGSSEIAGLEAEVQAFDPRLALDGGEDGLQAFRMILAEAFRVLGAKGLLIFETGDRQAQIVREMMVNSARGACCLEARVLDDLNGIERAVAGRRQSVDCETKSKKKVGNPALSG
jgi:release factor glutamine methyltransferase